MDNYRRLLIFNVDTITPGCNITLDLQIRHFGNAHVKLISLFVRKALVEYSGRQEQLELERQ